MFADRVKYTLIYKDQIWTLSEPINWRDDTVEYVRHRDYHGIFSEISTTLEFTNYSALFIREIYQKDGINAEITLKKEVRHPQTDRWELDYSGVLDLSEYEFSNKTVKVKINSSGLLSLLKARQNEKVEIDRLDTLDGVDLPSINTKTLGLEGRRILLVSEIGEKEDAYFNSEYFNFYSFSGKDYTLPTKMIADSSDNFFNILERDYWHTISCFFYKNILDNAVDIKLTLIFIYEWIFDIIKADNGLHVFLELKVIDDDWNTVQNYNLYDEIKSMQGSTISFPINVEQIFNLTINPNEKITLLLRLRKEPNTLGGSVNIREKLTKYRITVERDSYFEPSTTKTIMAHELGERLTKIIGGKRFYSDLLGRTDINYQTDGDAGLTALSHGHWVRQFPEDDDLFKKFTTSFKDYYESLDAIFCIGATVEKKGTLETLRIENRDYFYQKFVGIKLGKVANLSRKVAKDLHYSSIDIGYDKPSGDNLYEKAMGLDEYNTSTTLTTAISRFENPITIKSNYRADSYGIEFARRKPKEKYPTEDTRYDKEIFIFDVERTLGTNFRVSKWEDDLDSQPTGVFSPDTAFNLMFTPMRMIQRHASYIKAGLKKYYDSLLRYASSKGNSNMTTVKYGVSLQENGNLPINELKLARYGAEWVEFEYPLTWEIKQQLIGKTNGIPNVYGLIEFINEFGKKEKGYLFEVKGNNFKILV